MGGCVQGPMIADTLIHLRLEAQEQRATRLVQSGGKSSREEREAKRVQGV